MAAEIMRAAMRAFLTGVRLKKSATDIRAGVSIDQVIARQTGHLTRFPSLELTCDFGAQSGRVRFRLFLRVPIQHLVGLGDDADDPGIKSAAHLRTPVRRGRAR